MTHRKTVHVPLEATRWPIQREWVQLDDLCEGVFDCPHSTPVVTGTGPFVVRSQDVRSGVFRSDEAARVSEETYQERIARAEPVHGDILYSREGTYFGIAAEVPENTRVCLGQRMVLIRPRRGTLNSRFLRLWLNSPILSLHIHGFRDGTVAERLNMPTIRALPIPMFDIKEQETIASILGAFDDKIELNRQTNETLEALSRAIFNDWLVNFGPTRARAEARPAYLAPDMWAHFPDALDDQGIPNGWRMGQLQEIVELNPKEPLPGGVVAPYLDMAALPTAGSIPEVPVNREFTSGMRFRNGDTLLARITPCLENGKTAFIQRLPNKTIGWGSTEFIVIRPVPPVPMPYGYILARDPGFRARAIQSMTGTSGRQRARTELLAQHPVAIPDNQIWKAFGSIVEPMFERIRLAGEETQTLANLRDSTLPRLMSGKSA